LQTQRSFFSSRIWTLGIMTSCLISN
jgi:hypothetical protein